MPFEDLDKALMFYSNVKFSDADIISTITPHADILRYLRGTQIVFLEKGNPDAGVTHILLRHIRDFQRKGIEVDEIVPLLEHTISNIRPLNVTIQARGLALEYAFDDRRYPGLIHDTLRIAIGFNGFVVSAMPVGLSTVMGALRRFVN